MANISIPKTLFGIIYMVIPLLLWFVPSIGGLLPASWMVTAVVAAVFVIGLIFVLSQSNLVLRILTIVLLVGALAYAGYSEYPAVQSDFAQVDTDYETETGDFYSVDETAFQVKQELIAAHVVSGLPAFFNAAWLTTGIVMILIGALGLKEVFSYAAIPSNQSSRSLDSNAEITDDVAAATNRPTAEQRAAALAQLKAAAPSSGSTAAPQPVIKPAAAPETPAPAPVLAPAPSESSSTQSPFSMPSFTSEPTAPQPVIKTPDTSAMSPSSTMDSTYSRRNLDSPVTPTGKINIKLDLGDIPQVTVEEATVYKSADGSTSYYEEPTPAPAPAPAPVPEPVVASETEPTPKVLLSEPAPAANPFAAMGSPFGQPSAPAPAPEPEPEPVPEPAPAPTVNPFATMGSPFGQPSTPTPEPASTPTPTPAPTPAAKPAPAKPEQPKISDEAKQYIKELNQQVAELKTLYNQGMISQDEYIAQRTEILREMYNSEK